jgi:putative peptide zinc metalloprotease protein
MPGENGGLADGTVWTETEMPVPLGSRSESTALAEPAINGDGAATGSPPRRNAESEPSADDFAAERMLRAPVRRPDSGWRLALFRLSAGHVRVAPSAAELRQRELVARVKTPVRGCRKIAFISRKGGVGKTSTCLLMGHTFAFHRGDRVIALDGNPDAGTLGHRVRRETTETVTSLLADADEIERYADIRAYTSQSRTRLEVVAADDDPQITQAIGEEEFKRAIRLLERHYNLVCLDTGTGVLESATRGILDSADQVVVVIAPSLDGARAASSTLDWLGENGYRHLVDGAVGVINGVRPYNGMVDLDQIESHFAARCRAMVRIPWDSHLEAGAETVVEELRPETRHSYLELAAAVATGFADPLGRRS